MTHADALNQVDVGQGDDHDVQETLQEGEPVAKLALADNTTLSTNGLGKPMKLNCTPAQLLDVIDVETTTRECEVLHRPSDRCSLVIHIRRDQRWIEDVIADGVELPLVHLLAAANVQTFKLEAQVHILVIHFNETLSDRHIIVFILPEAIHRDKEGFK